MVAVFGCLMAGTAWAGKAPKVENLKPGQLQLIEHPLDVNVVFVGFREGAGITDIDKARFLADLPRTSRPRIRIPAFYGFPMDLGLEFTYRYHVTFAPKSFEDALFGYLAAHERSEPLTLYQRLYNRQAAARRQITRTTMIDGVDTEKWLGDHGQSIGVDTSQYTVFFLNWYGRSDFRDHLYDKPGEHDPDTGLSDSDNDLGPGDAWGGTPPDDPDRKLGDLRRIWFYDASSAVDFADASYDIESDAGYRMPPIWEYGNPNGYRPFDDVTGDLAKLARYVAIDSMFTPAPLYDPTIRSRSAPGIANKIQVDLTAFSAIPGFDSSGTVQGKLLRARLADLEPYRKFSYDVSGRPLAGEELDAYNCFRSSFGALYHTCYPGRGDPTGYADLYYSITDHLFDGYIEDEPDYEVPATLHQTPDELGAPLGGLADDDHATGAQSYTYIFNTPGRNHQPTPLSLPTPASVKFTPTDASHFAVAAAPHAFDAAMGADLGLHDDDTNEVALPFSFPYLGQTYDRIHVNSDGNITFGVGDNGYDRSLGALIDGPPRVAPFFRDMNPDAGGAVRAAVHRDRVVVTWDGVAPYGRGGPDTFQVVLAADGTITFTYNEIVVPFAVVGVSAGGHAVPVTKLKLGSDLPKTLPAGTIVEWATLGSGWGNTKLLTHEVGHHMGLSHPHDGYDYEQDIDFGPYGDFMFLNEGDYSDTVMGYGNYQSEYSQFDRDALDRDMTAIYINETNTLLGQLYDAGLESKYKADIEAADGRAGEAIARLRAMRYREAPRKALEAYEKILKAAVKEGVTASRMRTAAVRAGREPHFNPKRDPRVDTTLTAGR